MNGAPLTFGGQKNVDISSRYCPVDIDLFYFYRTNEERLRIDEVEAQKLEQQIR
jgi:hypothetical protein